MEPTENLMERVPSPESEVNFENNDTEILINRLRNPVIKSQIVDILYGQERFLHSLLKHEIWEPHMPEGWTGEERFRLLKGKNTGMIIDEEDLGARLQNEPTRESIEHEVDKNIDEIEKVTDISFGPDSPTAERMHLGWVVPWTGEKMTPKQKSITEAHEKGHRVRFYESERFLPAFDLSKVDISREDYEVHMKEREIGSEEYEDEAPSYEDFKKQYIEKYLFSAMEIAERMSQLKNYFGFKGTEVFTKEHLHYAREHYIQDTKMDNSMKYFFQAITPEREDVFIELINNSGI